jgi:iron complex outermembrane receptor protein
VRGVGTGSFSNTIEYNVSTLLDNAVLGRPEMGLVQYLDIDRVEILRSPQGMLFGKNASAGVINLVTMRPVLGETSGKARFEPGVPNTLQTGVESKAEAVRTSALA